MSVLQLLINNILTIPVLSFFLGSVTSIIKVSVRIPAKITTSITLFLLFSIGFKGGASLIDHSSHHFFTLLAALVIWAFLQPFASYYILRRWTKIDSATAVAVAACFSSVSVMTYIAGEAFLEKIGIQYDGALVTALAIMELPAIISALAIVQFFNISHRNSGKVVLKEVIFNKTVLLILTGMAIGAITRIINADWIGSMILLLFKPSLCIFLFNMGLIVGTHKDRFRQFSWPLTLFGIYTPLLNGFFGILLGYFFHLDVGTTTLVAILAASASYIAVPAAMRLALPEAKEGIYLPLSLGITFPFNVIVGIPLYNFIASKVVN